MFWAAFGSESGVWGDLLVAHAGESVSLTDITPPRALPVLTAHDISLPEH